MPDDRFYKELKELLESGEAEALPCIVNDEIVDFGIVINRSNKNVGWCHSE